MAPFHLLLALLLQCMITNADIQTQKNETASIETITEADELQNNASDLENVVENKSNHNEQIITADDGNLSSKSDNADVLMKDIYTATNDWMDMLLGSSSNLSPSTSLMAQATNSSKSPEEQLQEIKEVASEITMAIQSEMTNLLTYALNYVDKDAEDNKLRKRRSVETPMDSSQLVLRLLKHIKANNEYQNIAIEKMMTAQEIADKYGVEFNPDPEILSDLAYAANEQAKELTSILQDACDIKNTSCVLTTAENNTTTNTSKTNIPVDNTTHYMFPSDCETKPKLNVSVSQNHEHYYHPTLNAATDHFHYIDNPASYNYYNYNPYETQMGSPPVQHPHGAAVTPKPTFYDSISYDPNEYYAPYCSVDPAAYLSYQFEDPLAMAPELIGEEYEETISSRVIIEEDAVPGSATVNHVMTYTVSEKAHFRTPDIDRLPQQMQYYFFLM